MLHDTTNVGDGPSSGYGKSRWQELFKYLINVDSTTGYVAEALNGLAVSGTATPVTIATGAALVNGYFYLNDSSTTLSVPSPVTSTRIDRIILRWGNTAQTVRLVRLAGTEGGAAPALTQSSTTYEVSLATVSITTGGVITVTDTRAFLKSAAGRGLADGSTLNWNTSSKVLEVKDGGLTGAKLDQTSFSYPGIFTSTKTGGGSSAAIYLNASAPGIAWNVGGATSNNKRWDLVGVSNTLVLRMLDDSNGTVGSAITFTRSASTLTGVAINGPTTMVGNSSVTGTSFCEAALATIFPVSTEPVKVTFRTSGCSTSGAKVPGTTGRLSLSITCSLMPSRLRRISSSMIASHSARVSLLMLISGSSVPMKRYSVVSDRPGTSSFRPNATPAIA